MTSGTCGAIVSAMTYDWRTELGAVPDAPLLPGQTRNTHPITKAMAAGGGSRARAVAVIRHYLTEGQGMLTAVAEGLGCSWHVAFRLVHTAGLVDEAFALRLKHGHPPGRGNHVPARLRKKRVRRKPATNA